MDTFKPTPDFDAGS